MLILYQIEMRALGGYSNEEHKAERGFKRGKDGTLEAIKHLEYIQTDPINVVHRNQHRVLHNKVMDYKPSYLDELLYKDRRVFEYWCNEKSIIPIEDFPYFCHRMQNPS